LCLSEIKSGNIRDAIRRVSGGKEYALPSLRCAIGAKPAIQLDEEPTIKVREPNATTPPVPQDNRLMSQHRVLGFKPQLRLEWRGQDGQSEAEQPDHPASLGDSNAASHSNQVFGTHRHICAIHRGRCGAVRLTAGLDRVVMEVVPSDTLKSGRPLPTTFNCPARL
jgi:hypothetical protein